MIFRTSVELGPDDSFAYTPDAAATQVLAALGGNPTKDTSYVTIVQNATGQSGLDPMAPAEPPA